MINHMIKDSSVSNIPFYHSILNSPVILYTGLLSKDFECSAWYMAWYGS